METWTCTQCENINPDTAANCLRCQALRPTTAVPDEPPTPNVEEELAGLEGDAGTLVDAVGRLSSVLVTLVESRQQARTERDEAIRDAEQLREQLAQRPDYAPRVVAVRQSLQGALAYLNEAIDRASAP